MKTLAKIIAALINLLGLRNFFALVDYEVSKKDRLALAKGLGLEGETLERFMRKPS